MTKKNKLKGKGVNIPGALDGTAKKVERSAVAVLMHWAREIIETQKLELGLPDVDTTGADGLSPDMVIYKTRRSQKVLCLIEAKPPWVDVFSEPQLKQPAWKKAVSRKAPYFATTNFKDLIWFNTQKVNEQQAEEEQIVQKYHLGELEDFGELESTSLKQNIQRGLENFLRTLAAVSQGREHEPKLAVDELLVFRLQEKIGLLSQYYRDIIKEAFNENERFRHRLRLWFQEQRWEFGDSLEDFSRASRQAAYLLVNKILFYDVLQSRRPKDLDPLEVPEGITKGEGLRKILQAYFDQVLKIDYENIYSSDFIDELAFQDSREAVGEIRGLIRILRKYDFSALGYDVVGRIFEQLIPARERHVLGQYFTSPDVVDLILRFCLRHENDSVLDPACGAGTFLVRSYQHKKMMNQRLAHAVILDGLWGVDVAKFPAHLSIINLAIIKGSMVIWTISPHVHAAA